MYRIIYEEAKESDYEKRETLFGKKGASQSGNVSSASSIHGSVTSPTSPCQSMSCTVEDVLQLLRHLFVIYTRPENDNRICEYSCRVRLRKLVGEIKGFFQTKKEKVKYWVHNEY